MDAVSRNSPCPCGSGKKYKKCCISEPTPNVVAPPPEQPAVRRADTAEQVGEWASQQSRCRFTFWSAGQWGDAPTLSRVAQHECDGVAYAIADHGQLGPCWVEGSHPVLLSELLETDAEGLIEWLVGETYDFIEECEQVDRDPGHLVEELYPLVIATCALAPRLAKLEEFRAEAVPEPA